MGKLSQDPRYLIFRDLIGLKVYVKSKNPKKQKIKKFNEDISLRDGFIPVGTVIDETYNTLIIRTGNYPENSTNHQNYKIKKYIKKDYIFRFDLETESEIITVEIDGEKILKRPENRIKLLKKRKQRGL